MFKYSLNKTYKYSLPIIAAVCAFVFFAIYNEVDFENAVQYFQYILYVDYLANDSIVLIMMNLLPAVLFCIITSNYFSDDICISYHYVFFRAGSMHKWFFFKMLSLFFQAVEFFSVYFCVGLICNNFKSRSFNLKEIIVVLFFSLCYFLFAFASALFVNVLSLIFKSKISFLFYISSLSLCILSITNLKVYGLNILNPVYHLLVPLHQLPEVYYDYISHAEQISSIVSLGNTYSYFYFIIIIFPLCLIGLIAIKKESLLLKVEKQS